MFVMKNCTRGKPKKPYFYVARRERLPTVITEDRPAKDGQKGGKINIVRKFKNIIRKANAADIEKYRETYDAFVDYNPRENNLRVVKKNNDEDVVAETTEEVKATGGKKTARKATKSRKTGGRKKSA
jgi:hypothetical protein